MYKILEKTQNFGEFFAKRKIEIATIIQRCHDTINSCLLPKFIKVKRLKIFLESLQEQLRFLQEYDNYLLYDKLYDPEVVNLLKIVMAHIKQFEQVYEELYINENSNCCL